MITRFGSHHTQKVMTVTRLAERRCLSLGQLLLLSAVSFVNLGVAFGVHPCASCHPKEVEGYYRSAMAHSLRRPSKEPEGSFEHSLSGTKFTIYSSGTGLWQRMERDGDVSDYRVDYVIGSGNHASGYLVRVGDHLFQSPICYYTRPGRYDMAPGYEENRAPDFIRAVNEGCLFCHSGKALPIANTLNQYPSPAFAQESISCDRCHGNPARHLKMPLPGTIVNPATLAPAARDSICEQCHLKGVARVPSPGKKLQDFRPGEPLEEVFAIYTVKPPSDSPREALKVISHVEQLALSTCSRQSKGQLWCGTCHNPHDTSKQPPSYYRARCLSCHTGARSLAKSHPGGSNGDCVSCHMPKRNAKDGGHTVFTDHRVSRHPEPEPENEMTPHGDLVAWRDPPPKLRDRDLALAYASSGLENGLASEIVRGYHMLIEAEKVFPDDAAVLTALGQALLAMRQPLEAARRFERVLELGPDSAVGESDAGRAWMRAGNMDKAASHLERAISLDPLLLPAAEALMQIYQAQGDQDKATALSDHVREALGISAPRESRSQER
jgi:hypothetical protein